MSEKQLATIDKHKSSASISLFNFSIPENVLSQEVNGEVVLLNIENESYYSLNAAGSQMWQLLSEHQDIETVMPQLLETFVIDEAKLRQDLMELIEELIQEDLLAHL